MHFMVMATGILILMALSTAVKLLDYIGLPKEIIEEAAGLLQ